MTERYDVAVIGGGPAGLSAALNLVRARRRVLLIDSNRPRNSATLLSHGYLTRDGISPLELRKLGRDEFLGYDGAEHRQTLATNVVPVDGGFEISCEFRGQQSSAVAEAVLVTTGLSETLPEIAQLRAFYGTYIHSCIECDGYDKRDQPLALIGEHSDLVDRALLLSQWTDDLIVFTHGSDVVTPADEAALAARGIMVDRRRVTSIDGDRDGMRGVVLEDGTIVPRAGGFVRPEWSAALDYVSSTGADLDDDGLLVVDGHGRTSVPGLYAAGDGARVAAVMNRDLIGGLEHLADAVQ
jgi:thioredoxin reductase